MRDDTRKLIRSWFRKQLAASKPDAAVNMLHLPSVLRRVELNGNECHCTVEHVVCGVHHLPQQHDIFLLCHTLSSQPMPMRARFQA